MSGNSIRENPNQLKSNYLSIVNSIRQHLDSFEKIVVGYFYTETKASFIEIFYKRNDEYFDYIEEAKNDDEMDESVFDVTDVLEEMHEYCVSCHDDWKSFTLSIDNEGNFKVNYGYDVVEMNLTTKEIWKGTYLD